MVKDWKYEARGVISFRGSEGMGFNATLHLRENGRKIAFVYNDACGGPTNFEWLVPGEEALFTAHTKTLPNLPPSTVPEIAKAMPNGIEMNPDILMGELVDEYENNKKLRRKAKTYTMFRVWGDGQSEYRAIKRVYNEGANTYLVSMNSKNLIEIVNETILAELFSEKLLSRIGPYNMAKVIAQNNGSGGVCHTHDFCDANQVMLDAFKQIWGREGNPNGFDGLIMEKAWDNAKVNKFYLNLPECNEGVNCDNECQKCARTGPRRVKIESQKAEEQHYIKK